MRRFGTPTPTEAVKAEIDRARAGTAREIEAARGRRIDEMDRAGRDRYHGAGGDAAGWEGEQVEILRVGRQRAALAGDEATRRRNLRRYA